MSRREDLVQDGGERVANARYANALHESLERLASRSRSTEYRMRDHYLPPSIVAELETLGFVAYSRPFATSLTVTVGLTTAGWRRLEELRAEHGRRT